MTTSTQNVIIKYSIDKFSTGPFAPFTLLVAIAFLSFRVTEQTIFLQNMKWEIYEEAKQVVNVFLYKYLFLFVNYDDIFIYRYICNILS